MKHILFLDPPEQEALRAEEFRLTAMNRDAARQMYELDPDNYLWLADWANFEGRLAEQHLRMVRYEPWRVFNHVVSARDLARSSVRLYTVVLARSPRAVDNAMGRFFGMAQLVKAELDSAAKAATRFEYAAGEVEHYQGLAARYPSNRHWQGQLALAYYRGTAPLRSAAQDPDWDVLTRPEVAASVVRLAAALVDPPDLPPEQLKRTELSRPNAAIVLRGLEQRGALPPEGKAILAKLSPPK